MHSHSPFVLHQNSSYFRGDLLLNKMTRFPDVDLPADSARFPAL